LIPLTSGKVKLVFVNLYEKAGINKDAIKEGLLKFFGGDEAKVEGAFNSITDNLKTRETTSLSLTGIKEKLANENK
jgi:hypothetical protein